MEATTKKYVMDANRKDQFIGVLLLDYLINLKGELPILMQDNYKDIEALVIKMKAKEYLQISGDKYIASDKGKEVLKKFMQRYIEYVQLYDVYCAVDLAAGEFAFKKLFDFEVEAEWQDYLNEKRWEDCRIAVAEFKKIDPLEIVFLSFIREERFDLSKTGWQFDVYSGLIWTEIEKICNAALSVDDINQGDNEVIENVIKDGAELAIELVKKKEDHIALLEKEANESQNDNNVNVGDTLEETTVEVSMDDYYQPYSYYDPYLDPFYIGLIWSEPLFVW